MTIQIPNYGGEKTYTVEINGQKYTYTPDADGNIEVTDEAVVAVIENTKQAVATAADQRQIYMLTFGAEDAGTVPVANSDGTDMGMGLPYDLVVVGKYVGEEINYTLAQGSFENAVAKFAAQKPVTAVVFEINDLADREVPHGCRIIFPEFVSDNSSWDIDPDTDRQTEITEPTNITARVYDEVYVRINPDGSVTRLG